METATAKAIDAAQRQAEIRRQIEQLQAQLKDAPPEMPVSPPRKERSRAVLAPGTPSPKKRKVEHQRPVKDAIRPLVVKRAPGPGKRPHDKPEYAPAPAQPVSTFLSDLGSIAARAKHEVEPVPRSYAFSETPAVPPESLRDNTAPERDERLALVEELEPGPVEHTPPFDDPHFEKLEPNSGIHLQSRKLLHEDLQEYLRGRFFISPSRLYSIIRLLPNKQGFDVPVAGDWVTIAVVAERGPIRLTSGNGPSNNKEGDDDDKPSGPYAKKRKTGDEQPKKRTGKKYMNLKLVDFGHRSRASSNVKATIKGDALLSLLLFESDSFDRIQDSNGKVTKLYKGGSRGAFEELAKLKEGTVVALLNPKVLKPFQKSGESPHPLTNILALTPESAQSIAVIGHARDLGMCTVLKRDGKVCGGWCDKRVSEVCEYHIQTAVQSRRASRPEFSIGTSGMSSTSAGKRKAAYDPARQWGLKPSDKSTGDGETYVLSGHVVSAKGPEYVHETMGREGQSRAKRKLEEKEADRTLQMLLTRDRGGPDGAGEVVKKARLAAKSKPRSKAEKGKGKGKVKEKEESSDETSGSSGNDQDAEAKAVKKFSYPPEIVKKLGFDPTLKAGHKRLDNKSNTKKLIMPPGEVHLGPPPGPRIRSGVTAPQPREMAGGPPVSTGTVADGGDDDELESAERAVFGRMLAPAQEPTTASGDAAKRTGTGDVYDSDSDLEVEPPS